MVLHLKTSLSLFPVKVFLIEPDPEFHGVIWFPSRLFKLIEMGIQCVLIYLCLVIAFSVAQWWISSLYVDPLRKGPTTGGWNAQHTTSAALVCSCQPYIVLYFWLCRTEQWQLCRNNDLVYTAWKIGISLLTLSRKLMFQAFERELI